MKFIPNKFINKTFGNLYDLFCDNNLVILGLYRLSGATDNNSGYVYTKPNFDTKLTHRDKVFVLSTNEELKKVYRKNYKGYEEININKIHLNEEEIAKINNNKNKKKELKETNDNDYFEKRNKYSPFNYIKEQLFEIDKEVNKLQDFLDIIKVEYKENISNGIKEEISSLLQQY